MSGVHKLQPVVTATRELAMGGGLEGAERTSRETFTWNPAIISPDNQINPIKEMADGRARDAIQNDGYASGAVSIHRDSIIGAQYRLNLQPDFEAIGADQDWADEYQAFMEPRFNMLADSEDNLLDASGMNTFTGIMRLIVGGFLMTGEVLGTVEWLRAVNRPWSTAIQLISPSRLTNPNGMADTRYLRRGVTRDLFGKPQSYSIQSSHPGAFYMDPTQLQWREVPVAKPWGRRQVIHIIEQMFPDQSRGVSEMVAVLKNMKMTKNFQEVVLQNAVINASYAAAIESELPTDLVFGSLGAGKTGFTDMLGEYMTALQAYSGSSKNVSIDGAKIPHLFPGTKLNMQPIGTPGGVGSEFEQSLLRHTAAALGLSYEQFSHDYSMTNYSSSRAAGNEQWKYMQGRKKAVADRFATQVFTLVLEEDLNAGLVPLPKGRNASHFYTDPLFRQALINCTWIGASRGQVDEMKETQAAVMRINSGLSTYELEAARLGLDWRQLFNQIAREKARMEKLDIAFGPALAQMAAQAAIDAANQPDPVAEPGANDSKNQQQKSKVTKPKPKAK